MSVSTTVRRQATDVVTAQAHDLILTREFFRTRPASVPGRPVDTLAPLVRWHDIEGLERGG